MDLGSRIQNSGEDCDDARSLVGPEQRRCVTSRQHLPLWRLLLGELVWALRQLWEEPRVLTALVVGGVGTFAVLGDPAPGPVLPVPGRLLVALVGGLVLAPWSLGMDPTWPGGARAGNELRRQAAGGRPRAAAVLLSERRAVR